MGTKNDGQSMQFEFYGRAAGQDRKHFRLGTSMGIPGPNYFADVRGFANEQVIHDAIAGSLDPKDIEHVLTELLDSRKLAREFMWFRLKMRENAPRS
ncbi:hypothetical protein [Bradyrhizobium sp. SZCCHNPS1003]|uniref:hypothetical protein n=1 Tax=Bradyrhizobium sp. SZCCHNPS1003 TaxID=3057330 RepID=UPI0028ED98C9|nr:hypothetical protein [Bradyrhizobium sp. SZCCHNPS1003]